MTKPSRLLIAAAFAAVYVIWGSTYLAIHYAVETIPPFLMAAARWIPAGVLLYAWRRARGDPAPTLVQWRTAFIVGGLLIVGGNGLVSVAQQTVPSGITSLLVASVPLWIAVMDWVGPARVRPTPRVAFGIALGLVGVGVLVGPDALLAIGGRGIAGVGGSLLILLAAFLWANGSLYSRRAPRPASPLLGAAMQMLAGGLLLTLGGLAMGEASRLDVASIAPASWWALAFLALFGSIVAYSSYVWLLQVVRPEQAATYAFVNPVVAVMLGVFVAGEALTPRILVVGALIVVAVALIVTAPKRPAPAPPDAPVVEAQARV